MAVISLALIAQAQETTTVPTPNNGQLSPTRVTSTDEIIRLASQQRGNLSSTIFQFSPQSILKTDTFLSTQVVSDPVASFKKEQARKAKVQPLSVSVSPNPASTEVDIVIKGSQENMLLTITNNVGEVISQSEVNHYVTMGVSDLPNGLYYLTFLANTGEQIVSKLIIAK